MYLKDYSRSLKELLEQNSVRYCSCKASVLITTCLVISTIYVLLKKFFSMDVTKLLKKEKEKNEQLAKENQNIYASLQDSETSLQEMKQMLENLKKTIKESSTQCEKREKHYKEMEQKLCEANNKVGCLEIQLQESFKDRQNIKDKMQQQVSLKSFKQVVEEKDMLRREVIHCKDEIEAFKKIHVSGVKLKKFYAAYAKAKEDIQQKAISNCKKYIKDAIKEHLKQKPRSTE